MAKMTDEELVTAIENQESLAENYGNISEERIDALDRYLGEPYGNEVEGQSQVVSRDTFQAVEWIKPQIADIFCAGDEVVAFSPRGPEDVQAAEQETEYVNQEITQRNPWFEIFNGWMHDALLQKVGYVKVYWDDAEDKTQEKYKGLTEAERQLLNGQEGVEIIEEETYSVLGGVEVVTLYNVTLQRTQPANVCRVENVAPENVRVAQSARRMCLQDPRVPFVQHSELKTLSELRADGYDVPDDIVDDGNAMQDWEGEARDELMPFRDMQGEEVDPSMRRVWARDTWIRIDVDGDGHAELRRVMKVGTTILSNELADTIDLVALGPNPLPHQHYGLSIYDAVDDLEKIKTALLRGTLDNVYLSNNGRYGVDVNTVNMDDMLDSRPGGVVRVAGQPANSILPLTHPTNGQTGVQAMEYVDRILMQRTGVNEQSQGLNPNSLSNNAGAAANSAFMTAALQRIKYIARIFAETGVKSLFQLVHAKTLHHGRQRKLIRMRGQWVPVDPREWVKRVDMTVSVGLGTGDKPQQLMMLERILGMQVNGMQIGIAKPSNIYHTVKKYVQIAGYKDTEQFLNDPEMNPPPPPGPPLPVMVEQMKGQVAMQLEQAKAQAQAQLEAAKAQFEGQKAQLQAQMELQAKRADLELQATNDQRDSERELLKARYDAELKTLEQQHKQQEAVLKAEVAKYQTDKQAETQLRIAMMTTGKEVPDLKEGPDPILLDVQNTQQAIAQGVLDMGASQQGVMNDALAQLNAVSQSLAQVAQQIAQQMSRPRKVVRDGNNKIVGVE